MSLEGNPEVCVNFLFVSYPLMCFYHTLSRVAADEGFEMESGEDFEQGLSK